MGLFEIFEEKIREAGSFAILNPSLSRAVTAICKRPGRLQHIIDSLALDTNIFFVSDGDWSMHDLLTELLKIYGCSELWISTYAITEFPIRTIVQAMQAGQLTSVQMLIDYRAKVRMPEVFQLAAHNINRIRLTNVHAKVMVLKTASRGCVSVTGSANWTSNPRIEAGVISTDEAIAKFHIDWLSKSIDNADIFQ